MQEFIRTLLSEKLTRTFVFMHNKRLQEFLTNDFDPSVFLPFFFQKETTLVASCLLLWKQDKDLHSNLSSLPPVSSKNLP